MPPPPVLPPPLAPPPPVLPPLGSSSPGTSTPGTSTPGSSAVAFFAEVNEDMAVKALVVGAETAGTYIRV